MTNSIQTNTFTLSKKMLFSIQLSQYCRRKWWLMLGFPLFGVLDLLFLHPSDYTFPFIAMLFPFIMALVILRFVYSQGAKLAYSSRYFEITTTQVSAYLEDGSNVTLNIENYKKVRKIAGAYLLIVAPLSFTIIPASAFKTPEDLRWFEAHTISKIQHPDLL